MYVQYNIKATLMQTVNRLCKQTLCCGGNKVVANPFFGKTLLNLGIFKGEVLYNTNMKCGGKTRHVIPKGDC